MTPNAFRGRVSFVSNCSPSIGFTTLVDGRIIPCTCARNVMQEDNDSGDVSILGGCLLTDDSRQDHAADEEGADGTHHPADAAHDDVRRIDVSPLLHVCVSAHPRRS